MTGPSTAEIGGPAAHRIDPTLAGDSAAAAVWTLASRGTGLVRVLLAAAVFGPTFLGNIFQTANFLPWILYELAIGSLVGSLLVPPLVERLDRGDHAGLVSLARRFTTLLTLAFIAVVGAVMALSQLLARAFGAGVDDGLQSDFRSAAVILLLLTAPQLIGYGIISVSVAVQNANGRFGYPAAMPVVENLIVIGTLIAYAVLYGTGAEVNEVTTAELLLLGGGSTIAVLIHTILQWFGARRLGVTLGPAKPLGDPEVSEVLRLAVPASGSAVLNGSRLFALIFASGLVAGGTVAFQMALNFYNVAVALGAKPVSQALLPTLTRAEADGPTRFRNEYSSGVALAGILAIPAAIALTVLALPLANGVAFGEMANLFGRDLIRVALIGVGIGIIGETVFLVATSASYARRDAKRPFRAALLRTTATVAVLIAAGLFLDDVRLILAVALAVTVGDLLGALYLHASIVSVLPQGTFGLRSALLKMVAAGIVAIVPLGIAHRLWVGTDFGGQLSRVATLGLVVAVAIVAYLVALLVLRSSELRSLIEMMRGDRDEAEDAGDRRQPASPPAHPSGVAAAVAPMAVATPSRKDPIPRDVWPGSSMINDAGPAPTVLGDALLVGGTLLAALAVGILVTLSGAFGLALSGVIAISLAVWFHPPVAAWVLLAGVPLIIGVERGAVFPLVRLNELVLVFIGGVLILRWLLTSSRPSLRFLPIDYVLVGMATTGSFVPLLIQMGRLRAISADDIFYALTLWVLLGSYWTVRSVISTPSQVRVCLWLSLGTASAIGLLAALDGRGMFGIPYLLNDYGFGLTEGEIDNGRGSATIGNAIGLGGYMVINLIIALSMLLRGERPRWLLQIAMVCTLVGVIGSGQVSSLIGLVVGIVAYGLVTKQMTLIIRKGIPIALIGAIVLWPVISQRIDGFSAPDPGEEELPSSWEVRWDNLETHFIPEFDSVMDITFGVTTQARVEAPADEPWHQFIWIESGHLWLLWSGGIPFFIMFFVFLWKGVKETGTIMRSRGDPIGQAALAALAMLWTLAAVQTFDPHLTLRGTATIMYPLLALAMVDHPKLRAARPATPATALVVT